jgi:hypothetical protein
LAENSANTLQEAHRAIKALAAKLARVEHENSVFREQIEELQAQGTALTLVLANALGADAVEREDGFSHLSNLRSGLESDTKRMRSARAQEAVQRAFAILEAAKKNYAARLLKRGRH